MAKTGNGTVTIYDVAKHAGVSPMTVSRVVNNNAAVTPEMRARVMASVKALDFSINVAARSTRSGNIKLGMLYANPSGHYLNEVLVGALEQSSHIGCQLVLERCQDDGSQAEAIRALIAQKIDGVILPAPTCDSEVIVHEFEKAKIEVLSLASATPLDQVSAVRIDDFEAAVKMTRYLIKLGHRRIAFIKGDPGHSSSTVRYYGYCTALQAAGVQLEESLVAEGLYTYQSGLFAAQNLLRRHDPPTAIFASNDDMASAVLGVAHGMQLRIPEDLSVCGFDDTLVATATWPQITTIHQPIGEMGRVAVDVLVASIRAQRSGKPSDRIHKLMDFSLIERDSTGISRDNGVIRSQGQGSVLPR